MCCAVAYCSGELCDFSGSHAKFQMGEIQTLLMGGIISIGNLTAFFFFFPFLTYLVSFKVMIPSPCPAPHLFFYCYGEDGTLLKLLSENIWNNWLKKLIRSKFNCFVNKASFSVSAALSHFTIIRLIVSYFCEWPTKPTTIRINYAQKSCNKHQIKYFSQWNFFVCIVSFRNSLIKPAYGWFKT